MSGLLIGQQRDTFRHKVKIKCQYCTCSKYLTDDKDEHILSDEDIRLSSLKGQKAYPKNLRIVKVYDEKNDQTLILLTNNMSWTANTVSQFIKARWP